jgi:hypothetical protein
MTKLEIEMLLTNAERLGERGARIVSNDPKHLRTRIYNVMRANNITHWRITLPPKENELWLVRKD